MNLIRIKQHDTKNEHIQRQVNSGPCQFITPSLVKTISKLFSQFLFPQFTSITTTKNTSAKDRMGSHLPGTETDFCRCNATTADNFNAAANPIINAIMENNATTSPLRMLLW